MVHISLACPAGKVRQVVEAGLPPRLLVAMYLRIVLGECSTPSFALNSNAIRSSPHSGWSDEIRRIKVMWLREILGRPLNPPDRCRQ
jgi:hypothetical protein